MAGPGGREAGRVSIRALPDTTVFARSLKRYLERVEKTLRIKIPTVLDDSQVQAQARKLRETIERNAINLDVEADVHQAVAQIERATRDRRATINVGLDRRDLQRITRQLTSVTSSILKMGVAAGAVAGSLTIASQAAASLAVPLAQATGAIAAMGPAALLSAGAVGGTLVAAFAGISDSAVPAVEELRAALESLAGPFRQVQESIRASLFDGLADQLRALGTEYLPVLESRLSGIGEALNGMARDFAAVLQNPQSIADTNTGLANLEQFLANASEAVQPLVRAFRDLAVVGSEFLPAMGTGIADLSERFADFIEQARQSGELKQFFEDGFTALASLGELLKNVGRIVGSVFEALETSGGNMLGIMSEVTDQIADFLESAQGQEALVSLFDSLARSGQALGPVFAAIATAIGDLAPHVADLVETLAPGLEALVEGVSAGLQAAAPGLTAFGEALGAGIEQLAPALEPLGEAFGAMLEAVAPLLPLLAVIAATLIEAFAPVIEAIAPVLETVATTLAESLGPVLPVLAEAFAVMAEALAPIAEDLGVALVEMMEALAPIMPEIATAFADLVVALLGLLEQITPLLPLLIQLVMTVFTRPVLMLIIGVAKAITGMAEALSGLVEGIKAPLKSLGNFIGKVREVWNNVRTARQIVVEQWNNLMERTRDAWRNIRTSVTDAWNNMKQRITDGINNAKQRIRDGWDNAKQWTADTWKAIQKRVRNAWRDLKRAVREGIDRAIDFIRKLPERAVKALGNIGNTLKESGRDLMRGFADGIRSMADTVSDAASSVLSKARGLFPSSPAKRGPFSGRGWTLYSGEAIGDSLAEGMRRKTQVVSAAAERLAAYAHPSTRGIAGAALAGATAGGAGGDTYVFNGNRLDINERTIGPVLHGLRVKSRVGVGRPV